LCSIQEPAVRSFCVALARSRGVGIEVEPRYRVYTARMKIGQLSKEAGVKVGTIRFYERRNLLKPPQRTSSGYRSYVAQDVKVVKGIKQLQELGFTLREIKELIDLHRSAARLPSNRTERGGVQRMIALTKEKLQIIEKKSQVLRQMRRDVAKMLANLQASAEKACPVAREMAAAPSCRKS